MSEAGSGQEHGLPNERGGRHKSVRKAFGRGVKRNSSERGRRR